MFAPGYETKFFQRHPLRTLAEGQGRGEKFLVHGEYKPKMENPSALSRLGLSVICVDGSGGPIHFTQNRRLVHAPNPAPSPSRSPSAEKAN